MSSKVDTLILQLLSYDRISMSKTLIYLQGLSLLLMKSPSSFLLLDFRIVYKFLCH